MKVTWFDEHKYSANVVVTDGKFSITAFSSPNEYKEGEIIEKPLVPLDCLEIHRLSEKTIKFKEPVYNENQDVYIIHGKVVNYRKIGTVDNDADILCGDILINLNGVPGDIEEGDWVQAVFNRIDLPFK